MRDKLAWLAPFVITLAHHQSSLKLPHVQGEPKFGRKHRI